MTDQRQIATRRINSKLVIRLVISVFIGVCIPVWSYALDGLFHGAWLLWAPGFALSAWLHPEALFNESPGMVLLIPAFLFNWLFYFIIGFAVLSLVAWRRGTTRKSVSRYGGTALKDIR